MLANALKEFEVALEDLASNSGFVGAAARLRPRLNEMLRWESLDGEARSLVRKFLDQQTAEQSLLYRGMVISLAGAFEHFVRRILRDSILAISGSGVSYDALDEGIRKENFLRTGIALGTINEPLDYLDLDYQSLAKNLGTCFSGSPQVLLNADAFAIFLSIVSPKNLADALRRVGVGLSWDDFGKVSTIQKAFDKRGTRETAKAVEDFLKRFGQMRNKIAHTGSSGIVITESDFEQLLNFFKVFSHVLVKVVEADLKKLVPK
jgi:hypothetical protein